MKTDKIAILNDISSDNINLINFLDIFAKFSQNTEDIEEFMYLNENISQSFFRLTKLKKEDLEDILDTLKLIKDKSKKEDLDIYGEEVERGISEINWLIEEKNLSQNIFQEFDNKNILDKNSIVNELYRNEDASRSQYLIKTFSNKLWKELDEETIINFLNGLDFYYLSNEAYFFILPACIRYGLEKFEENEQLDYLTFFLSDKERVKNANEKIKILVVSYLNLLKKLNFLGFFEKEEKECLELWK
ncbi:primosomal protein N [Fusobacterium pseudoperiodonticum]